MFARFDEIPSMTKILRKLSIQKPLRITRGNNSNVLALVVIKCICPEDWNGLQGLVKFHQCKVW